jgi:hypothetical protein
MPMTRRSTSVAFAVVVTMMLPIGTALAQGAAPAPSGTVGTTGIGNASGVPAGTTGIGNASSINSGSINSGPGAAIAAPPLVAQSAPPAPEAVQGFAEREQISPTGRAVPGPDGVSTRIVAARPCSRSARETDGITTCVGIPATQEASYSGRRSRHRRS